MGFDVTDGRQILEASPTLHPPSTFTSPHPSLCALIFYFFSQARCCLSSLQHILSYPPLTPPPPTCVISHTLPPQSHTLTYEHTHSFNLLPFSSFTSLTSLSFFLSLRHQDCWRQLAASDLSYGCSVVSSDTQTWQADRQVERQALINSRSVS